MTAIATATAVETEVLSEFGPHPNIVEPDIIQPDFEMKALLNGFPKSGLHLLVLTMRPLLKPAPVDHPIFDQAWSGNFKYHSWSLEASQTERVTFKTGRMPPGTYLKSHMGFDQNIERFLYFFGCAQIFIYRDPRDVAVSQTYHIMEMPEEKALHPGRELYKELGNFDEALKAVIQGLDIYPGVMDRWEQYAPWLDVPWVFKVRYEDLLTDTETWAKSMLEYAVNRTARIWGSEADFQSEVTDVIVQRMAHTAHQTHMSPTFREGKIGKWKTHFTDEHKDLFKVSDKNNWLVRLDYAEDENW